MLHVWQKSKIKGSFQTSVVLGQGCEVIRMAVLVSGTAPGLKDHHSLSKRLSYSVYLPGECKGLRAFGVWTFSSSVSGSHSAVPLCVLLGFPLWTSPWGVSVSFKSLGKQAGFRNFTWRLRAESIPPPKANRCLYSDSSHFLWLW